MGWDRVRFFETIGEQGQPTATLISADKQSAEVVYGRDFSKMLGFLGHKATTVLDRPEVAKRIDGHISIEPHARDVLQKYALYEVIDFPDTAREEWYGWPTASYAIEVQPPLSGRDTEIVTNYLVEYCDPSDAGPLFLDHRNGHRGCAFPPGQSGAICPSRTA